VPATLQGLQWILLATVGPFFIGALLIAM